MNMKLRMTFKKRLFLTVTLIFAIFLVISLLIEQYKEQSLKRDALIEQLEIFTDIVDKSLVRQTNETNELNSVLSLLPEKLRLSIVESNGDVVFDNSVNSYSTLSNHSQRPEIETARKQEKGFDIRVSESNQHKYIYFAKKYNNIYIRAALPYDLETIQVLQPDNFFLYISLLLFVVVLIVVNYVSNRLSYSINSLADVVIDAETQDIDKLSFKEPEINKISIRLIEYFNKLKDSKKQIQLEKEKLLQHIQTSQEGICFFSKDHEVLFYNGLFIQNINLFFDGRAICPNVIINEEYIPGLKDFINHKNKSTQPDFFESQITAHGRFFSIRASVFSNNEYEIVINDITIEERTKQLKQQMTGNISHELRTPITSIRGYLETVLSQNLPEEKKIYFLQKAEKQTLLLSELINDMSLLHKIDDNATGFNFENVLMSELLENIVAEYTNQLEINKDILTWNIPNNTVINGNRNLLASIFKNLIENSLRYAGEDIEINISLYNEDQLFYYFSYYDTGVGIKDDKHLNRLFERFYRVQEGRTRDTGGSGLGLAIVKNAVTFHKGTIVAKHHSGGGLEFLIKIKK